MTNEEVLKNYICLRYKSIRQFAIEHNLKYSTITAVLSRGLSNSSIDTVFEICKSLGILVEPLVQEGKIVPLNNQAADMYRNLESYSGLLEILNASKVYTIDGVPLSTKEMHLFSFGVKALVETIRQERANSKENIPEDSNEESN